MSDKIREALAKLDVNNEEHWTTEGLPRLDVMKDLVGVVVTRADITASVKGFSRKTPNLQDDVQITINNTEQLEQENVELGIAPEDGSEEAIEAALTAATAALYKAQAEHKKAVEDMDVVMARRDARSAGRTTALDIQTYQRVQAEQRAKVIQRQRLMADAISATKDKF